MAKRKGPSTSRPRDRSKVAKEGSESKTASERGVEDECEQLEREVRALEGERSRLSEEKRRLEEQLEEQLRPLRREMEQVQRNLLTKRKRIVEVENTKRLDKLPKEVWERIFDELNENDLFPLALSCKYFRQKQVELVARSEQSPRWGGCLLLL